MVASIYDPLGFLAPFVLKEKQILQRLCRENKDWDEALSDEIKSSWIQCYSSTTLLTAVYIPRCVLASSSKSPCKNEMHHFADASTIGYGTCTYLRQIDDEGTVSLSLLMDKARVAPKKVTAIPRLELEAAVFSVKVADFLTSELGYTSLVNFF